MSTAHRQQTSRSSGLSSIDFFWVVGMDFRPTRRIGAPCGCGPDKHVIFANDISLLLECAPQRVDMREKCGIALGMQICNLIA